MSAQETKLSAIADAIREKDGTTAPIPANDFPDRIRAISTMPDGLRTISVRSNLSESGLVSGGGMATDGMIVTVKAVPPEGYRFDGWQENSEMVSSDVDYTFTVAEDRQLNGIFDNSRLPFGYREVQYIEADGTQFANIAITVNELLTSRILVDAEVDGTVFGGAVNTSNTLAYYWSIYSKKGEYITACAGSKTFVYFGGGQNPVEGPQGRSIFELNCLNASTTAIARVNELSESITRSTSNSQNIYVSLLARRQRNNVNSTVSFYGIASSAKVYSVQLYNNSGLTRDYVPCISPDGEVGLYEQINGNFYKSAGANPFIAGPRT